MTRSYSHYQFVTFETFGTYPCDRTYYENRIELLDESASALCYAVVENCHFFERHFTGDVNRYYLKATDVYRTIYQQVSLFFDIFLRTMNIFYRL